MTHTREHVELSGASITLHLWSHRRAILVWTLAAGLLAAGVSLLLPNQYTASVSILPDKQGSFSAGALSQIASNFGVNLNRSDGLTDLYPAMINSERILGPILSRPLPTRRAGVQSTLLQLWSLDDEDAAKAFEQGLKRFRERALDVSSDRRTGIVTSAVTLKDPVLAAAVANAIATDMDAFVRVFQRTQAQDQVRWIQTRLDQVLEDLRRSEVALRDFRERNRSILTSPELQLRQQRLLRDVETNSAVYVELRRQMELAKIDEVKNIPVVHVLDPARVPVKKSAPRRTIMVLGAMLGVLMGTVSWVLIALRLELEPSGGGAQVLSRIRADVGAGWMRRRAPR